MARNHGLTLYLNSQLNMGVVDLQAKQRLGRSFAGLLALTEGLYALKCISKEAYEDFKTRYSSPLIQPEPLPFKDLKKKMSIEDKNKGLEKLFADVIEQWPSLSPKSRAYHVKNALNNPDIPNAQRVIVLAEK